MPVLGRDNEFAIHSLKIITIQFKDGHVAVKASDVYGAYSREKFLAKKQMLGTADNNWATICAAMGRLDRLGGGEIGKCKH